MSEKVFKSWCQRGREITMQRYPWKVKFFTSNGAMKMKSFYLLFLCVFMMFGFQMSGIAGGALFENAKDKLLIIQCDEKTGSGFVCEIDGVRYLVTNKHIIEGQTQLRATFSDGKSLRIGRMEVAKDADLVRFIVPTNQPAFKIRDGEPRMHESVCVFGNSDGSMVLTDLRGEVVGVGPDKIEITAKFVHGNSGSVVLGEDGKVLGVATYASKNANPDDWVKEDSRFSQVRRYALRMDRHVWVGSTLMQFKKDYDKRVVATKKDLGILPEVTASFVRPSLSFSKRGKDLKGNVVLSLSSVHCKNPIVRVVALIEADSGRCVVDGVAIQPHRGYGYCGIPIYDYGMESQNRTWSVGNGRSVYYLEGLSYYQRQLVIPQSKPGAGKNLEYFKRDGYGLDTGELGLYIETKDPSPKIVAYRFECWQNGSLAGSYNSLRPQALQAKGVPVDWFILYKYKDLFDYNKGGHWLYVD